MYDAIAQAAMFLLTPGNLGWLALGTVLGLVAGTLPGISGVSMMALILPFTYGMAPETAVLMLVGVYAASTYSSSTGGILYNIPGGAAGIPATVEGYRLAQKGRIGQALSGDIYASFFGSVIGFLGALILTPLFIAVASMLGTAERGLFALLALVLVGTGALSRADPLRGILSVGLGLMIATVGMQPNTGFVRYVQAFPQMWDGVNLIWLIVGLYAIPQTFRLATIEQYFRTTRDADLHYDIRAETRDYLSYAGRHKGLIIRTGLMGTLVGALPGLGTVAASWLGYQEAYRSSKNKDEFGKGSLEGLTGAETANNAAVPTTLVPLLALGIPGSAASSLILGAFLLAGVHPGPRMMEVNPETVWAILLGLFLTGFFFVIFGLPFHRVAVYITKMRPAYLIPAIVAFSAIGTFLATGFVEGIYITLLIGLIAMLLERLHLSISNILLGAILGPIIEQELVTAFAIGGIDRFARPGSLILLTIIAVFLIYGLAKNLLPALAGAFAPFRGGAASGGVER
ncbi:tripartite tricarboxylate transporter permease [Marinivivus vitaminiproducens]|uniref:tripartite tricarboxylate transporter permease n=1 Tax=Marinivivus vitaminiproducens TaxID=3035935 RepID=UPI0027A44E84|nr:tripartite tricarboxylate transporter permease [Geminicoccaceae bacterium SCSIO 64248]